MQSAQTEAKQLFLSYLKKKVLLLEMLRELDSVSWNKKKKMETYFYFFMEDLA